ncbi:carotenoid biosynthesis protein [Halobacteriaceae archaeon GCM10025711]
MPTDDAAFRLSLAFAGLVALVHALLTWPVRAVLVLFLGGAALAFVAETAVVRLGLLVHHTGPRVFGVPLPVLVGWPAAVYAWYRVALVVADGTVAVALAAVLATLADVVVDPRGVAGGYWTYPETWASRPRFRGVPWWNFVGWLVLVGVMAAGAARML